MKCMSCGASYDDEEMYFCTVCGAMMKNPITKELVPDSPDDTESAPLEAEAQEQTVSDAPQQEEIKESPEAEAPHEAEALPKAEEIEEAKEAAPPVAESVIPEKEVIPPVTENIPPVAENPPPPVETKPLYIEREREKEKMSQFDAPPAPPTPSNDEMPDITENAPKSQAAPSAPKKVSAGRIFGANIIALFAAIVLIAVSLLFSLKLGLSPERMSNSVKKMDVWTIINAEVDNMTVSDAVYLEANFDKATHGFADKEEFAFYLSKTDVTGFLSDKVKIYADYILNGKGEEPTVTENEVTDYFMEYHDTAKDIFSYDMQTADYNSIRSSLADRKLSDRFSVSGIGWAIKFRLENVKHILSYPTLTILAVLFIVLLIWIAVAVNHKGKYTLGLYGDIFKWGGIITIASGFLASPIMALMYVLYEKFPYLCISNLLFPSAVYAVIIGAILTVAGMIFLKAKRAIKVKEKINKSI